MIEFAPMPIVNDFLVSYHIGHALLLGFILVVPAGVIKKSPKVTAVNAMLFGGLFLLAPGIDPSVSLAYAIFGIALLVVGPVIYTTSDR